MNISIAELTGGPATVKSIIPELDKAQLKIVVRSHGLKRFPIVFPHKNSTHIEDQKLGYSLLPVADYYVDCRGIQEHGMGVDRNAAGPFKAFVEKRNKAMIEAMLVIIEEGLEQLPRRRFDPILPGKNVYARPYQILCFCAYGCNRSPTTKKILVERLKAKGYNVQMDGDPLDKYLLSEE